MLWEIRAKGLAVTTAEAAARLRGSSTCSLTSGDGGPVAASARGYLLEGDLPREQAQQLLNELLLDPLVETGKLGALKRALRTGLAWRRCCSSPASWTRRP